MRTVAALRWLTLAVLYLAAVACFAFATARYAEARNPHETPTTSCCAAGTHGNAGTPR